LHRTLLEDSKWRVASPEPFPSHLVPLVKTLELFVQWGEIPDRILFVDLACPLYHPNDNDGRGETNMAFSTDFLVVGCNVTRLLEIAFLRYSKRLDTDALCPSISEYLLSGNHKSSQKILLLYSRRRGWRFVPDDHEVQERLISAMITLCNRSSDGFHNTFPPWWRGDEVITMSESDAEALIEGLLQCPWTTEPEEQETRRQVWKWLAERGYEEATEKPVFPIPLKNWPPPLDE